MNPRVRKAAQAAKRLALRAGIEVNRRGGGGVRRTPEAVLGHVKRLGFEPATVIDVGVAYGTPELYDAFPRARFLLVDPLEEYAPVIDQITARLGDAEWVRAAAGPEPGQIEINVNRAPALSSTLGHWKGQDDGGQPRSVPVVRIDDLVAERSLPGPYVLKVDVEGAELRVLDGASSVLERTDIVLLEVNLFQFLPGQPQLHDVVAYMKERGFVTYDFYGGHLRLLDGALAMTNMVFVREDGRFRGSHDFATEEQAREMYEGWGF
jgi:FkbM family methyltransferase